MWHFCNDCLAAVSDKCTFGSNLRPVSFKWCLLVRNRCCLETLCLLRGSAFRLHVLIPGRLWIRQAWRYAVVYAKPKWIFCSEVKPCVFPCFFHSGHSCLAVFFPLVISLADCQAITIKTFCIFNHQQWFLLSLQKSLCKLNLNNLSLTVKSTASTELALYCQTVLPSLLLPPPKRRKREKQSHADFGVLSKTCRIADTMAQRNKKDVYIFPPLLADVF